MKKTTRADEMEVSINLRAIRVSWVLTAIFLIVWNVFVFIKDGAISTIPFVLLMLQVFSMFITKVILSSKMGRSNDVDK